MPQLPTKKNDRDTVSNTLDYLLENVKRSVSSIDVNTIERFIDLILSAKTVFVYGSGRSGLSGQFFCVRLVQLGLDVHFVGEMTTPIIGKGDLTILVSNTGVTSSAVQTAKIARRIGSKVVSVTAEHESKMANVSDLVIHIPMLREQERSTNAPLGTIFEESATIFFDSIVPCIMERTKNTESDMKKRHAIWV